MVPQHNPFRKTLAYSAVVIGVAALGAVVLYFATVGLLYLRSNFCGGSRSSIWCHDANITRPNAHKQLTTKSRGNENAGELRDDTPRLKLIAKSLRSRPGAYGQLEA